MSKTTEVKVVEVQLEDPLPGIVDASRFISGSPTEQRAFAVELVDSVRRCGFVKVINHGLSDELIDELFAWCQSSHVVQNERFFAIDPEQKLAVVNPPGPSPQRGWSCVGAEKASRLFSRGQTSLDLTDARRNQEHFDAGSPSDTKWPSRWPDEAVIPGFKAFLEDFYVRSHQAALLILEALEMGLNLPAGVLKSRCGGCASELRLNNYPEIDIEELRRGKISRIHPHADLGVITCLFQDGLGGLELEHRSHAGSFLPVPPGARSEMVVNISETFQLWTNNVITAGIHQVTVPPEMKTRTEGRISARRSCAFFLKANGDASVAPLPQFVTQERPAAYSEMTALDYHQKRLATAY
uniref:2-oxoglutarate-dependent dioxygenase phqC n=1 Tax=Penicillium fellutanum TaxID=70095 RepID=PHQC_PENFE|nr:RecName: Full=2-oxoglutarate-dependent dioxygenase phqC; AltName: Full=Paraherquamide biosynthesis cluster protein C [Penicillium fellutanum]AGA37270.1 2OG-Fe(II)-oxygenase [Penicillium fellutanum]